ncbi:BPSS1780 family membrane protein [Uliginosibacterium sp. H1]|uniref:BPSS1780 family membrane protein n=1 Tax=Uliginosibacterium sp. H1 TaxID=3114757 RepID=UPI002E18D956|nr:BPSS1780 family membrane protein [Uliginosibacterium sp. H1]
MNPTPPNAPAGSHHRPHSFPFRRVTAGRCLHWLAEGWRLFAAAPVQWLLMALLAFLLLFLGALLAPIPLLGPMVGPVVMVFVVAGMLEAAARVQRGEAPRARDLFAGFDRHPAHLLLLGLFFSIPLVLVSLLTLLAIGGGLLVGLLGAALGGALHGLLSGLTAFAAFLFGTWTVFLIVWGIMLLALLFAPALVMFDSASPLDAMRASLKASLANPGATLLCGLLLSLLFALALMPAGLGVLVLLPVAIGALYTAWREVLATDSMTEPTALPPPAQD